MEFLGGFLLWFKALHVISVFAWMAGLFYLPRLFVYHCQTVMGDERSVMLQVMERKLYQVIMQPAMMASWGFGFLTLWASDFSQFYDGWWMWFKLFGVISLTAFHFMLNKYRLAFIDDTNGYDEKFYRLINEIPTIILILVIIMVIVRPF